LETSKKAESTEEGILYILLLLLNQLLFRFRHGSFFSSVFIGYCYKEKIQQKAQDQQ
jgi:hypothetical protein